MIKIGPISVDVPFFMICSSIIAYLIWSIYLNGKKLDKPNTSSQFFDIFAILALVLASAIQISILVAPAFILYDRYYWNTFFYIANAILIIGIILFLFVMIKFEQEDTTKDKLYKRLGIVYYFQLLSLSMISGFILALSATTYFDIFYRDFLRFFLLSVFTFFVSVWPVSRFPVISLTKKLNLKILNTPIGFIQILAVLFLIFTLLVAAISWVSIPHLKPQEQKFVDHTVNRPNSVGSDIYSVSESTVGVGTFGYLESIMTRVPLRVDLEEFVETSIVNDKVSLYAIKKDNSTVGIIDDLKKVEIDIIVPIQNDFFGSYLYDTSKEVLFLYFDETKKVDLIKEISLKGTILNQNRNKFNYTKRSFCEENKCGVTFSIKNSLDEPLRQRTEGLINLKDKFPTVDSCNLTDISYTFSSEFDEVDDYCERKECSILARRKGNKLFEITIEIDNERLELQHVVMKEKMELQVSTNVTC